MAKRSISPEVRSRAQPSSTSWVGMSQVLAPAGKAARHSSIAGVETPGAIHIPTPAATKGWGWPSSFAANCAASMGSAPSTPTSSDRAPSSAKGAQRATSSHAPSAETT